MQNYSQYNTHCRINKNLLSPVYMHDGIKKKILSNGPHPRNTYKWALLSVSWSKKEELVTIDGFKISLLVFQMAISSNYNVCTIFLFLVFESIEIHTTRFVFNKRLKTDPINTFPVTEWSWFYEYHPLRRKKKSSNQNIWQLRGHISDMMSYSAFSYGRGNWQAHGMKYIF